MGLCGTVFNSLAMFLCKFIYMFIWHRIKCGVPQGSILGPVFLNLYMLYYADDTQGYIAVFSDDTAPIDTLLECILEIKS